MVCKAPVPSEDAMPYGTRQYIQSSASRAGLEPWCFERERRKEGERERVREGERESGRAGEGERERGREGERERGREGERERGREGERERGREGERERGREGERERGREGERERGRTDEWDTDVGAARAKREVSFCIADRCLTTARLAPRVVQ